MISRKKIKEKIIGKVAKYMVRKSEKAPKIATWNNKLDNSRVAFITTAGVHLKMDKPFDVNGDHTCRLIPGNSNLEDLIITHDHYDKENALKDINCVFPIDILRNFSKRGIIKEVAPRNFGLMGYIPEVDKLINETAIYIADCLVEDKVDIALLSPG